MAHAETLCRERGQRLTPIRRQVLETLARSHRPLGAYEIMDRLAANGPRPAPITVYRALEFLLDNGLVHRIESRNAFLACMRRSRRGDGCRRCSSSASAAARSAKPPRRRWPRPCRRLARAAGFTPKAPVIEITGICAHCRHEVMSRPRVRSMRSRPRSWSLLCLSWGFNQVAVKLALPDIPPLIQAAMRSAIGRAAGRRVGARCAACRLCARDGTLCPASSPARCSGSSSC